MRRLVVAVRNDVPDSRGGPWERAVEMTRANLTEPHLHLHVCAAPDPVRSQGVPFEFRLFEVLRANPAGRDALIGRREAEIPLDGDVLRFR